MIPAVEMQLSERCRYSLSQNSARVKDLQFRDVVGKSSEIKTKPLIRDGEETAPKMFSYLEL